MTKFETLLQEFPEAVQESLKHIWGRLSTEQQKEFEQLLRLLPDSLKPLKDILGLILDQYRPVFGRKHRIAIVGPANVGKSTLHNQLILHEEDEVAVSPVPGTTRQSQETDIGLFVLIDTPGADAVGEVGDQEREIAFAAARQADFLIIVFEATRGIKRYEKDLFEALLALEKPYLVIVNKMDLIPAADRDQVHHIAAHNLRLEKDQLIDTIAIEGRNVGRIILAITKTEPALLAAIAQAMPDYQAKLAWQRILPAAGLAGTIGLTPLPFLDLVPLLGLQAGLILSIARIYGYQINLARATELVATFGVGMAARTAFQQVSKLGGVPGWVLSAAIATSTTVAIGYASLLWFAYGEKPTQASLKKLLTETSTYLKEQLLELGQEKPDRPALRKRLDQALQALPNRLSLNHKGPTGMSHDHLGPANR